MFSPKQEESVDACISIGAERVDMPLMLMRRTFQGQSRKETSARRRVPEHSNASSDQRSIFFMSLTLLIALRAMDANVGLGIPYESYVKHIDILICL